MWSVCVVVAIVGGICSIARHSRYPLPKRATFRDLEDKFDP